MREGCSKVCVTGASGYIASSLVKKLLAKGHSVHATLRDLSLYKNESKVSLLKSLPQSEGKLVLFEADIYNPNDFDHAIEGCEFVFHVATPMIHDPGSQYKNTSEAAMAASKSIALSCVRAGTVKRLIYTASVVSASSLKEDGSGFKDAMDETCWTPLNDSLAYVYPDDPFYKDYTYSKTLSEKHVLSYGNDENGGGLEVVTLPCGLVGGDTLQSSTPVSGVVCIAQIMQDARAYISLKFLKKLLGKIPLVHIDDVCEAHIFCMESTSISGRFLCASSYISLEEMANHFALHYPEFNVKQEYEDELKKDIKWASTKLCDKGFVYKYDAKMILDDCIKCARRMGDL
ncbi:putative anthocyanidin reductase [Glycine max]|uniref:NAD-dependent epimerase/dehydratase domain-containing protein n=1 Tax=Glycine max TaxID=3847 RepID=I1NCJ5_SOYBN|nr:putative anthocyanidin reductase [Glycine max]|eukprot:XP_014627542.1 putative anthocyanidin reductase isoform X2 [Glycine max]